MTKRNYAKREEQEYNCWVRAFQIFAIYIVVIPIIKLMQNIKVTGTENVPKDESFILAPTHTNYLDPILACYATKKPVAYMAKKELFDIWWLRPLIVGLGAFAVNREKLEIATIKTSQMIIRTRKWMLSLFPQGSRDEAKKITKLTPGFAYFARVAKAKVLPVSIVLKETKREKTDFINKFAAIFDDSPLFSKFKSSYSTYEIVVGKPIDYSKNLADTMEKWCEEICAISEYSLEESAKQKILEEREKEEKSKDESVNTKS